MATTIQVFDNQDFGAIRTVTDGGSVLFCGRDVTIALGYKDPVKLVELSSEGTLSHDDRSLHRVKFRGLPARDL